MRRNLLNVKQKQPRIPPSQVLAADGAITIQEGYAFLSKSSAGAFTLAAPGKEMNGCRLSLFAVSAQAHVVTYTAGFNGSGAGTDTATFGGAVGDKLVVVAYNGIWYVETNTNITLS